MTLLQKKQKVAYPYAMILSGLRILSAIIILGTIFYTPVIEAEVGWYDISNTGIEMLFELLDNCRVLLTESNARVSEVNFLALFIIGTVAGLICYSIYEIVQTLYLVFTNKNHAAVFRQSRRRIYHSIVWSVVFYVLCLANILVPVIYSAVREFGAGDWFEEFRDAFLSGDAPIKTLTYIPVILQMLVLTAVIIIGKSYKKAVKEKIKLDAPQESASDGADELASAREIYQVQLVYAGPYHGETADVLRDMTLLVGWLEIKNATDDLPSIIAENFSLTDAMALKTALSHVEARAVILNQETGTVVE